MSIDIFEPPMTGTIKVEVIGFHEDEQSFLVKKGDTTLEVPLNEVNVDPPDDWDDDLSEVDWTENDDWKGYL